LGRIKKLKAHYEIASKIEELKVRSWKQVIVTIDIRLMNTLVVLAFFGRP
jgi:hypothetical protein